MKPLTYMCFVFLASIGLLGGCIPTCPEPAPVEDRLYPIRPGMFREVGRDALPDFEKRPPWHHPWSAELTVEAASRDEVRISYERDGRRVVETYRVRERSLYDSWSGRSFPADAAP